MMPLDFPHTQQSVQADTAATPNRSRSLTDWLARRLRRGLGWMGAFGLAAMVGCQSSAQHLPFGGAGCPDRSCQTGECDSCESCPPGGYCEHCEPPKRWTSEWYAAHAGLPIGSRQKEKHGKLWPPYPRPVGPQVPISHRFHASHYWPWPYNCQDRESLFLTTQAHIDNGWVDECTLWSYHFDDETQALNHAGEQHLRRVLETVPEPHRNLWVQNGESVDVSQNRANAVRIAAANIVGEGNVPEVMVRIARPASTPAREIDAQSRALINSLPEPRIQYTPLPQGTSGGT